MNRLDFQRLAEERLLDADALLTSKRWSAAYYLAGYAVECGLKACIAKLTKEHDFPDKDFAQKAYTHRLDDLVRVARLTSQRDAAENANPTFGANWLVVKTWDESSRYSQWSEAKARRIVNAIADPNNGVLPWMKSLW